MGVCDEQILAASQSVSADTISAIAPSNTLPGARSLIRAEANLLRFPLFALHTKGIRTLDGIRCSGRLQQADQTVQYSYTATRNTSTLYPGPLARSAHLAFLSILTEAGTPVPHPLTWSWRDLCRRMGIIYGGEIVRELKQAILSTAGLLIRSESALFSKPEGKRISTREEALHLYERVVFAGSTLPDGSTADENHLWLSDWYRANLDAFFTAPLDFALWKHLDEKSPIASRLYEFLLVNFFSDAPQLCLNYETLAQFLPVKAEKYLSSAQRQFASALDLLQATGILHKSAWRDSKTGIAQIVFERGQRMALPTPARDTPGTLATPEMPDAVSIEELRNQRPPEWYLVNDFYRDFTGDLLHRPTPKELNLAKDLIEQHGATKARQIIAAIVKRLKVQWPEAKTFGAVTAYLKDAIAESERRALQTQRNKESRLAAEQEREDAVKREGALAALRPRWLTLPESEREAIRAHVLARQPRALLKFPETVERFCLEELARRQAGQPEEVAPTV